MICRGGEFCTWFEITHEYGLTEIKERVFTCMGMIKCKIRVLFLGSREVDGNGVKRRCQLYL